ncbi:hypothetical protein B2J93_2207 [Marssonina coronariae]|uniref:Uncharacterized protein n=1 Tax=Diplocarpon coronariae TaxID=2795749 RepID=A0A218YTN9_9HELO|nr:hypothetical protein B2J93_2207 [Marssonina coronariae]
MGVALCAMTSGVQVRRGSIATALSVLLQAPSSKLQAARRTESTYKRSRGRVEPTATGDLAEGFSTRRSVAGQRSARPDVRIPERVADAESARASSQPGGRVNPGGKESPLTPSQA